jgi:choline dehydrogenase-like flavoprotein
VPGLVKATPFGFHGHLAGTLPMRASPGPLESDASGRLSGTRRVFVVDTAAFPTLPAQNLTFTAMANAMRIASGLEGQVR